MKSFNLSLIAYLFAPFGLVLSVAATAMQSFDVRDGVTVQAKISIKDTSRIKVDGQLITDVFGDVRSNGVGRLMVTTDEAKGELYVRPIFGDATPEAIHIFVVTVAGTYGLLLQPEHIPADTIALFDRSNGNGNGNVMGGAGNSGAGTGAKLGDKASDKPVSSYVRQLKNMMVAMASDNLSGLQVRDINLPVLLWKEVDYVHVRDVVSGACTGSQYHLRAKLGQPMRLDEREFFTDGVAAVAIAQLDLPPNGSTHVYTIKCGAR
jgi:conjugal transfer pilus assembly protein TraK